MDSSGTESVLLVEVPAAEATVGWHREHLDVNASLGIPAHITVLSPFMPPPMISPLVLAELKRVFASIRRFHLQLAATGWFGDQVLWLAPTDPALFRALTHGVHEAFPAFPPFGGQYDEVIPHLTVGHGRPVNELRAAEKSVQPQLPIEADATTVRLMTEQSAGGLCMGHGCHIRPGLSLPRPGSVARSAGHGPCSQRRCLSQSN
jgi:2'-5' RNA ligase superfamily